MFAVNVNCSLCVSAVARLRIFVFILRHFALIKMKQYLEESMAIPEKIYETNGAEETFEVGMRLAKEAKAGDIYCLDGDLGTGKTVFSQGFAAGLA